MLWLVMPASGSCQLLPGVSSASSGLIAINQPVGRGPLARSNKADDVRTIQDALNRVTVANVAGGPMPFLASRVTPDFAAFIILHEQSHFVGRANGQEIHNFGRGWFNEPFIAPLKAEQRLANADSYATFAQECLADKPDKPPFVESRPAALPACAERKSALWRCPGDMHRRSIFG